MKRRVFYSFHYDQDAWRASQVRNIGVLDGNRPATPNDWETVKKGGDLAIKRWINGQMEGRTCCVVLVGSHTANRKWIDYEIIHAWEKRIGIVGIYIHGLKDQNQNISEKGRNPFDFIVSGERRLSSIVKCYEPIGWNSSERHAWIVEHSRRQS